MRKTCVLVCLGLLGAVAAGCERQTAPPPPAAAHAPATQPARNNTIPPLPKATAQASSTEPAQPTPAYMEIDERRVEFPPARLRVATRSGGVSALLMSDDPPQAINDDYRGNSFYLEMELPVQSTGDVSGTIARYEARTSERVDSRNGIFLDGGRLQLQPFDVSIEFDGTAPLMTTTISGTFLKFDTQDERSIPQLVSVRGQMFAAVR
jgi:hypothetical protein